MKHFKNFQSEKNVLTEKQLRTIKGGDDAATTTDQEEDIDRGGGRPKTNKG